MAQNSEIKVLLYGVPGPHSVRSEELWINRLDTIGSVLKADAYDFAVLTEVTAPRDGSGRNMLADFVDYLPDYSFFYSPHYPNIQISEGILLCYRHSRWEGDLDAGFRIWPPNTDRVLFSSLFYELDEEKKRTGRAVYVASSQFRPDEDLDIMREAMALQMMYYLARRPHPEYPVIWAGDVGMGEDSYLYRYITGETVPMATEDDHTAPFKFQDPLRILHPDTKSVATINNWHDFVPEGGVRRDYILASEGLVPKSLDYNYIRTPGGMFPSNHYPQRAVLMFEEKSEGPLH